MIALYRDPEGKNALKTKSGNVTASAGNIASSDATT